MEDSAKISILEKVIGKEKIEAIKQLFSAEQKFADYKLTDGTIIRTENLQEGSAVMVITENGETTAPNGEHTLEDGTVIVVADGKIVSVTKKEEQAEKKNEETPTQFSVSEKMWNEFNEKIEALKQNISALIEENKKQKDIFAKVESVEKQNKAMFEIIEKISEQPAGEPTAKPKKLSVENKMDIFRDIKQFKKELKQDIKNK